MSADEIRALAYEWFRFAEEDLEAAQSLRSRSEVAPRTICWLSQQAAEKAIKAALVLEQIEFPFVHDLEALIRLVPAEWRVTRTDADLVTLSRWAVEARYPGDWPLPTAADATTALEHARTVVGAVRADLQRSA
jgi:HEPN domain-containing protein